MKNNIKGIFLLYISYFIICSAVTSVTAQKQQEDEVEVITEENMRNNVVGSAISSFSLIFLSEIGDKTFFLVMIYSMSNSALKALLLASATMAFMTFLAVILGSGLSFLIYKNILSWIAVCCFTFFASLMFYAAFTKKSKSVEEKLNKKMAKIEKAQQGENNNENNLREPLITKNEKDDKKDYIKDRKDDNKNKDKNINTETAVIDVKSKGSETKHSGAVISAWPFVLMLIVGELGDNSQIATVLMGAVQNFTGVFIGGSLAHACCILVAIIFGNLVSKTITTKHVHIMGGTMFTLFAITYLLDIYQIKLF